MTSSFSCWHERLYRWLLALYPAAFRREYGSQLVQVFLDNLEEASTGAGNLGVLRLWMETLMDLLSTATAEHLTIFWQDLRYGARMLLKDFGFTAVAVLVLAIGIGATSAMLSIVNGVLLRPLPFSAPERVTVIWQTSSRENDDQVRVSIPNFLDWRERSRVFAEMALMRTESRNYLSDRAPERVRVLRVSPAIMSITGLRPLLGRGLLPEEETPGNEQVALLSEGYWRRRFDGSPAVLGRSMRLDGKNFTVVGVMPAVDLPNGVHRNPDLWVPLAPTVEERKESRGNFSYLVVGRLQAGATIAQAEAEMANIARQLERQYPGENTDVGVNIVPYREELVGAVRPALLVLLGAVALVLLIACANVANLLLVRASVRGREIAIRTALGAGRGRLLRQLLTENLLLATLGGSLGLLFAWGAVQAVVAFNPGSLPRVSEIRLDGSVVALTGGIAVLTALAFSIAPALQVSQVTLGETLKEGGRGTTAGGTRQKVRNALVVVEVALALVLLSAAGLLARSYLTLQSVDPGFNPRQLLTASLILPDAGYEKPESRIRFYRNLIERVQQLPGVKKAAVVATLPLSGSNMFLSFTVREHPPKPTGQEDAAGFNLADHAYFRTMGIPVLRGRGFTTTDTERAQKVAVISESMARRFFKGEDPIGKHIRISYDGNPEHEIVGIVGDVRHEGLDSAGRAEMYVPYVQAAFPFMTVVLRTATDPQTLSQAVRQAVLAVDAGQPVGTVQTMEQFLADNIAAPRFNTLLLAAFAVVALVLAAVGLYGVMAYSVNQRTHEIGVRMALGARPNDILGLVVGQGMVLALVGVAVGLAGTLAVARLLDSLLYGIGSTDIATFAAVAVLLAAVTLVACWLPARRATRVDPMVALRYE